MAEDEERRGRARRRALRAAQTVTLGLAIATGGCAQSHRPRDSGTSVDASPDARFDAWSPPDAEPDAWTPPDAEPDACPDTRDGYCPPEIWDDPDCCEASGGFWDPCFGGCAVPGPFQPPDMPA